VAWAARTRAWRSSGAACLASSAAWRLSAAAWRRSWAASRVRAAGPGDHAGERPHPDPVPSHPDGERGLGPEVGPDRRPDRHRLPPELHAALVQLALLGLEPLGLPPQRGELGLQGDPLRLQLGGLPAEDRLLVEQPGLLLLELALLGQEL
jgi:hypothetical protein